MNTRNTVSEFDAIVIGSGYGGSVAAFRLAEAGLEVAVLETGYAHKAPNLPRGEASEWNPARGSFGPHTVQHLSKTVTAWRGTAVGGGSIVNAAVMIRKDEFQNWPGGITRDSLDPFYDLAERMLGATTYPLMRAATPYAATVKTRVMLEAGEKLGVPTVMPPVAITYRAPGEAVGTVKVNQYGAEQQGCRQCGECSLPGCNYQAKNSLDLTYLHGAQHLHGATILPGQKVDKIEQILDTGLPGETGGYRITATDSRTGEVSVYKARVVVVAAGSIGSSELLLRNKFVHKTLEFLSPYLGNQYTTNGTFIGFAIRSKKNLEPSGGPEITAGLDFDGPDGKNQGTLMFDGSFRGFSYDTFYITGLLARLPKWAIKMASAGFKMAEKTGLLNPNKTLPLLVIGRDKAVGRFSLNSKNELQTDLNPRDNIPFYKQANKHMRAFCRAMGTKFLPFPLWSLQNKIDVPHNLGGVPMGDSVNQGVVDDLGRVYLYDNLLVLDGSIIPTTLGANPALTIAALAERSMATVIPQLKKDGRIRASSDQPSPTVRDLELKIPINLTREFGTAHADAHFHRVIPDFSKPAVAPWNGKIVLWTQGILARHMSNHSEQVLDRVRKLGYGLFKMPIDTDVKTAENIEMIKDKIDSIDEGQIILIGHSRGGNMSLDAYRQLSPANKAKVTQIILLQAPINGSPVANYAIATNFRRRVVSLFSRVVFGNDIEETLVELSTRARRHAQRALPPLTAEDRAKILTFRTEIWRGESRSFELPRRINQAAGEDSDGMTPYRLSAIPGVRDVSLRGYDHEMLVIQRPSWLKRLSGYKPSRKYEAGDVIEALLQVAGA